MKRMFVGATLLILMSMSQPAVAGGLFGSAAFGGFLQPPFTGLNVTTITSVTFRSGRLGAGLSGSTQDLAGHSYSFGKITINFTPTGLTLTGAGFGTFSSTGITNLGAQTSGNSVFQQYRFIGNYTPGSDFVGKTSVQGGVITSVPQLSDFTISLTQTGGIGQTISVGGTFITPSQFLPPLAVVPEPGTYVAALLGVVPFVVARRRRLV